MKREIKFRAKAINNDFFKGAWVDGYYTKRLWDEKLVDVITDGAHEIPIQIETLDQFTGKTDINGKDIYNDDVVRVFTVERSFNVVVKWSNYSMAFMACYVDGNYSPFYLFTGLFVYELEVIGNVFDNPELLKGCSHE